MLRRRIRSVSWMAVASALACGPQAAGTEGASTQAGTEGAGTAGDEEAPVPFAGGTRLVPRFLASPEDPAHVAQLLGWYDSLLELDCDFVETVAGDIRCLPSDTLAIRGYASPDCAPGTEIAIIASQQFDCDQGTVTYWQNAPGADEMCGEWSPRYGAITLGEKLAIAQAYRNDGGACSPQFKPSPDWTANYCRYTEAPLSGFVGADLVTEAVGTIERRTLAGEDGSSQIWQGHDPAIGRGVYPDRGRLLPSVGGSLAAFADPGCSAPAACGSPCRGDVTVFWDESGCAADVARLGDVEVDGHFLDSDVCTAFQPNPNFWCYEVTELRPPLNYEGAPVGTGRLQLVWARHADALLVPDGNFYDTELATRCYPAEPSPGQFLCESSESFTSSVFSDPECLVRIGVERAGDACGPAPGVVRGPDGPLRAIPLPVEGPTYTRNGQPDDGPAFNCTERPASAPLYDLVPAEVGWAPLVRM